MTGVTKRYGAVRALTGVSVRLRTGSVLGIVGPNGSGKSTLLSIAAGLVSPDQGDVTVCGIPAGSIAAARSVAFVPDEPAGLDELTARELLSLLAVLHGSSSHVTRRRESLVERFALYPLLQRRLGELSRGQRRRIALVAALQLDVPLVLVDEATATLDAAAIAALRTAIADCARRGAGVLLASHDALFVSAVADEIAVLVDGEVVRRADPTGLPAERSCAPVVV